MRAGVPDWSRTNGLQSRSLTLYPTELRVQMIFSGRNIALVLVDVHKIIAFKLNIVNLTEI